jgi:hypothetical protein
MKPNAVMIDIETLGTDPDAIVLSIGAVTFNTLDTPGAFFGEFYEILEIDSQKTLGRTVSKDTLNWWKNQSADARMVLTTTERSNTKDALTRLHSFIGGLKVWGNGSDFDNVIMKSLFTDYGIPCPWEFWNNRCFRTFKNEFKGLVVAPPFRETKHNALYDAEHQARHLQMIFRELAERGVV